jgi:hypothetical protein
MSDQSAKEHHRLVVGVAATLGLLMFSAVATAEAPIAAGPARPRPPRTDVGGEITIQTSAITAGGVVSTGGDFSAISTSGQPAVGALSGGDFTMTGGYPPAGPIVLDPPMTGDDTCQTASTDTGIACHTDADCAPPAVCGNKSRYLSITPSNKAVAGGGSTTIKVEVVSLGPPFPPGHRAGEIWWAAAEQAVNNSPSSSLRGALLLCEATPSNAQVWTSGTVHLFGPLVVPSSTYIVKMCTASGSTCSDPLPVATGKWGDVIRPFGGISQPAFGDINEIVFKFRNLSSSPAMPRVDLVGMGNPGQPNTPNQNANFADIAADVEAFRSLPFPYTVPSCPP